MSVASLCCKSFCVVPCVSFCTGHFVMVHLNMTYLHCLQHSLFEHLFNLYSNSNTRYAQFVFGTQGIGHLKKSKYMYIVFVLSRIYGMLCVMDTGFLFQSASEGGVKDVDNRHTNPANSRGLIRNHVYSVHLKTQTILTMKLSYSEFVHIN